MSYDVTPWRRTDGGYDCPRCWDVWATAEGLRDHLQRCKADLVLQLEQERNKPLLQPEQWDRAGDFVMAGVSLLSWTAAWFYFRSFEGFRRRQRAAAKRRPSLLFRLAAPFPKQAAAAEPADGCER